MSSSFSSNKVETNENTVPFYIRASKGDIPGVNVFVGTFSHTDIDSADGFIDSFGSGGIIKQQWTPPTIEETLYVSSTNASDTSGTIIVTYLDSNFVVKTHIFTPNGQNFVSGPTDFFRMRSTLITTGVLLGNIYISTTATGTAGVPTDSTKIMDLIAIGLTSVSSTLYTVPKGTTSFIGSIQTSTSGGQNSDITTRTVVYSGGITTILEGNIFGPGVISNEMLEFQSPLPEGLTIVIRMMATQNNSVISQRFFFVEFDDLVYNDWKRLRSG